MLRGDEAALIARHEALTVDVEDAGELQARHIAIHRPRGVTREQIDLPGLQRIKPRRRIDGHEFDLVGIPEHGRRHGAAEIDIEADPAACIRLLGKPEQVRIDAAQQLAARAHVHHLS